MFLHVVDIKHIKNHRVWLKFNDGASGEIDLSSELDKGIFKDLKDLKYFSDFSLEGHTIAWKNGADFAPEFLREKLN